MPEVRCTKCIFSTYERETNFKVIVNFVVLIIMCAVCAVVYGILDARTGTSAEFFEAGSDPSAYPVVNAIVNFAYVSLSCPTVFEPLGSFFK